MYTLSRKKNVEFVVIIYYKPIHINQYNTILYYDIQDIMILKHTHTVYHESFEAEKFHGFHMVCETFLYESSRWPCSNMDLRESIWDSAKVFLQRSACTTCRKSFLP